MKNSADLEECYPPRPSASVDNTFLDLQNSSYPTQPHSIIANYFYPVRRKRKTEFLSEQFQKGELSGQKSDPQEFRKQ